MKPSNHADMKRVFSVCFFILTLYLATAQTVSPNAANSTATSKPRSLTDAEIDFVPDATNSAAQTQGFHEPAKDTDTFFEETKLNAEKGDAQAQFNLAGCYATGDGVTKDEAEAAKWCRKAAEQNNLEAQFILAGCYASGDGVTKDDVEAVKWYRKAAEQNCIKAQFNLGVCYHKGRGVEKDDIEAVKWWTESAEQGDETSQDVVAYAYEKGNGVVQDYGLAAKWYLRAALQGDMGAQSSLGDFFSSGKGVPKNNVEAYKWYNLASAHSSNDEHEKKIISDCANLRDLMVKLGEITPEEITEAQHRSALFVPQKESSKSNSDSLNNGDSPTASGTGFFITDDGYLISNYHVVKDAAKVRLVTSAGTVDAKVIQLDAANDLALLKADGKFSPLPIAASRSAHLGGTVATVGFPDPSLQGFSPKLAKGEIASLSGAGDDPRYFQISVPVQPGNSGGALVDERGNVIGIVSAKLDASVALAASGALPENVNYAVKSSLLLSFLESVPEVDAKLKAPNTKDEKFEEVVKSAQDAAVLVLVY